MGGGALLGDLVGGGAGAASFAMRAAMAEALPDDFGVFAAAFSFLAASSLAFAFAIISATPIFARATALRGPGAPPLFIIMRRWFRARQAFLAALGVTQDHACGPRVSTCRYNPSKRTQASAG